MNPVIYKVVILIQALLIALMAHEQHRAINRTQGLMKTCNHLMEAIDTLQAADAELKAADKRLKAAAEALERQCQGRSL